MIIQSVLPAIENLEPLTVWGLFPRLLGAVYLIAFASLYRQAPPFIGARGISPIKEQLQKIRSDYPAHKRIVYFPTLLWIKADDWFIRLLMAMGIGASLWAVYGGPWSRLALVICWSVYLSFSLPLALTFPWDCLLLEAGFIASFLPLVNGLPDLVEVHDYDGRVQRMKPIFESRGFLTIVSQEDWEAHKLINAFTIYAVRV
ncbi:MAG: hypothetical protein ACREBD_08295 [Blastocatellia bacterium]